MHYGLKNSSSVFQECNLGDYYNAKSGEIGMYVNMYVFSNYPVRVPY